jgi:hypothetical protein
MMLPTKATTMRMTTVVIQNPFQNGAALVSGGSRPADIMNKFIAPK